MPSPTTYDAIIVGAGHNGLVAACYLARAGRRVLVLERRHVVGGACVTEELWPGYKVSTAAYVVSLFATEIARELRLADYGFRVLPRDPSSFTPLPDGRYLLLGPDTAANQQSIAAFSQRDAEAYPHYEALLERIAQVIEPTLACTPPDLLPLPRSWRRPGLRKRLRDLRTARTLWRAAASLGNDLPEAIELLTGAARPFLDRWFESDALKATLATDAIIGTFAPISAPGTAYVLLHHVMGLSGTGVPPLSGTGVSPGRRGVWGYVQGGMGALTQALARAATALGATIETGAEVAAIRVREGRAAGVTLADGREFDAPVVASNADPHVTFEKLIDPALLPDDFRRAVARIDYSSASMKINLALAELPDFTCLSHSNSTGVSPVAAAAGRGKAQRAPARGQPGPHHRGTIHIGPSLDYLERAYDDAKYGRPSNEPILEITIPSAVDPTIAPPGRHIMSIFVQYAPYRLADTSTSGTGVSPVPSPPSWDTIKEPFADRCLEILARYAPNVPAAVLHRQVLSPLDLERAFALTGGNIFHGAMNLNQLFSLRPVPGWSDYRTPIRGLYLCGAAAHPGGGVMGLAGRNAAREILRDRW